MRLYTFTRQTLCALLLFLPIFAFADASSLNVETRQDWYITKTYLPEKITSITQGSDHAIVGLACTKNTSCYAVAKVGVECNKSCAQDISMFVHTRSETFEAKGTCLTMGGGNYFYFKAWEKLRTAFENEEGFTLYVPKNGVNTASKGNQFSVYQFSNNLGAKSALQETVDILNIPQ